MDQVYDPGATAAQVTTAVNDGRSIINYIGHGSPFKISDESVFQDADVGTLVNGDRLPLFVAASCDIGKFDDPAIPSLGERLLTRKGGGAVGVISATELARSGENAALNTFVYDELFRRDPSGRYATTASEALLLGKLSFGSPGGVNSQKYQLLGDAAFRASRFLIDELKKSLPVWKKEFYPGGEHWIGDRS